MVPSLRHPDTMSIPDVARALGTISENVRDGKITAADMQGSTFTISNLGGIPADHSTPIINVPEVAILRSALSQDAGGGERRDRHPPDDAAELVV